MARLDQILTKEKNPANQVSFGPVLGPILGPGSVIRYQSGKYGLFLEGATSNAASRTSPKQARFQEPSPRFLRASTLRGPSRFLGVFPSPGQARFRPRPARIARKSPRTAEPILGKIVARPRLATQDRRVRKTRNSFTQKKPLISEGQPSSHTTQA